MALMAAAPNDDARFEAKQELMARTAELMPQGKPQYLEMRNYPMLGALVKQEGYKNVLKIVMALVKDFCASLNVVRNMSEDQMIEAAGMLIDECGNFRLEDYVMMFALAKRGQLVKVLDRMDIQIVGQMIDEYWKIRNAAGVREQDREPEYILPADAKIANPAQVSAAMKDFVEQVKGIMAKDNEASEQEIEVRRQEIIRRQRAIYEGEPLENKNNVDNKL